MADDHRSFRDGPQGPFSRWPGQGVGGGGRAAPNPGPESAEDGARLSDENGEPSPGGDGETAGSDAGESSTEGAPKASDPLAVALTERDEYLDALRRLQAEFDNYRKRVVSQQAEQSARGVALLIDKLLPVLDTLDLAVQHLGDADSADGKALAATGAQLHGLLAKEGLERIDPDGDVFDPNDHEAVGHVPAEGDEPEDEDGPPPKPVVAQVLRPGYRWKGAVLRPAMVTVRG